MSSSSHEIVLTSSPNGTIVAYDVNSGTTLAQFTGSHSPRRGLTVVGKDFEKSYIASSHVSPTTGSASVHLYNWCPIHKKAVTCLAINPDESLLISGSDEGTIAVVPIFRLIGDSGCENAEDIILHKFAAHSDSVTAVVSGTGLFYSQIISCSANSTCKFWSLRRGTLMRTVLFPCVISAIALHPTKPAFYAAGSDGLIYMGSFMVGSRKLVIHDTELITLPHKHSSAVVSVVFVQTGRYLVSASENGVVWIWDVAIGQVVTALGNEIASISDLGPATGFNPKKRLRSEVDDAAQYNIGFSCEELIKSMPAQQMIDTEDLLKVAAKDRSKAIDSIESAIAIYQRLLELILNEATKGTLDSKQK